MATNLVSLIMQFVTPSMTSKIASALGLPHDSVQKAVAAAIPALLAGFADMAAKPGGGQQLSNAFAQQAGFLDQLKGAIGSGSEKALAAGGGDMLSSLFGSGASNALAGTIGRFAGIDAGASKSLLGIIGPIAASVLGQQQRSAGLDAKGLTDLLSSQKGQIAAAMPAGLAKALGSTGLLDNLGDAWLRGGAAASSAAGRVSEMPEAAVANAAQAARGIGSGMGGLPYWVLGLAVLGILGWLFLGREDSEKVAEAQPPAAKSTTTIGAGMPDARLADLTVELTSSVRNARAALQELADPNLVQTALPKLRQATAQFETIDQAASQLPPNARREIASYVERSMPMLNQLCDKVLATPQMTEIAKPSIDAFRATLESMTRS